MFSLNKTWQINYKSQRVVIQLAKLFVVFNINPYLIIPTSSYWIIFARRSVGNLQKYQTL